MWNPKGLRVTFLRAMIVAFLRSSYTQASHSIALRIIMKTILDEQRREFQEDNEPTVVSFVIDQTVKASKMKKDWGLTEKLMNICSEPNWKNNFPS